MQRKQEKSPNFGDLPPLNVFDDSDHDGDTLKDLTNMLNSALRLTDVAKDADALFDGQFGYKDYSNGASSVKTDFFTSSTANAKVYTTGINAAKAVMVEIQQICTPQKMAAVLRKHGEQIEMVLNKTIDLVKKIVNLTQGYDLPKAQKVGLDRIQQALLNLRSQMFPKYPVEPTKEKTSDCSIS